MKVSISKYNNLNLRINTEDPDYISIMRAEFTRKVQNFRFVPAYRSGKWNGMVCMIDKWKHTFPYGLLFDFIRIHKKNYPHIKLEIDQDVKNLFIGPELEIEYDLKLFPRPYQIDCIEGCLEHTKGIIRSSTASGKSLVIAYVIKILLDNKCIDKAVIIVPSKGLIAQFYQDLIDYGIDSSIIGMAFSGRKQWDKTILISTWQTLKNNHDKLDQFQCIIADETHGAKAHELKQILEKGTKAEYRFGFTGTMHAKSLDNWNTKAFIGPIIREYPSGLLAEQGWISKCTVNMVNIEYREDFWHGEYHGIRDLVFQNDYRMRLIKKMVGDLDHNVLVLVDKVEKEGELLKQFLSNDVNKEVVFLSGKDNIDVREKWRKECMKRKDICLIATYGIFQVGVNIPNLKYIVLASPFKAKIRVLQSIGRSLRLHEIKEEEGAQIFDIHDHTKFFEKYGNVRSRYYESEGFKVEELIFHEGDDLFKDFFPFADHLSSK